MTQKNYQTFLNIHKRREKISRLSQVPPAAANVAYTALDPLTSKTGLSIVDRSITLSANVIDESRQIIAENTQTIVTDTEHFLVTDVFVSSSSAGDIPLFYKHILSVDRVLRTDLVSLVVDPGYEILEVEVLDTFMKTVKNPALIVDKNIGVVYSNFSQEYNNPGNYDVFYVRYTVRVGSDIFSYVELLSQEPVYHVATFEDIDLSGNINPGQKAYFIEEIPNGYIITLPSIATYGIKSTSASRIRVNLPPVRGVDDPWYVRVSNGSFKQNIGGVFHKFYIAEFLAQDFYPTYPYKPSIWEFSTFVDHNLIKLDYENLVLNEVDQFHLSIQVTGKDGIPRAAFTTDSALVGTYAPNGKAYIKWDYNNQIGIRSAAKDIGLVEIDGIDLQSTDIIKSKYTYAETEYQFTRIDNNPITNIGAEEEMLVIFLKAEPASSTYSQTLFYLIVDKDGKVTRTDNPDLNALSDPLYYHNKPSWVSGAFVSFDSYTLDNGGLFFVLGEITNSLPQNIYDVVSIDTRVRGGGILENRISEALEIQPELIWYADLGFWDGLPFPDTANYLVEVPIEIMSGSGGKFSGPEITDIVNKHTALGVYPVIRGYGISVVVKDIIYDNTGLTIQWENYGNPLTMESFTSNTYFNIYLKTEVASLWSKLNPSPLIESSPYTTYKITNLLPGVKYQISIVPGIIDGSGFVPLLNQPIGPNKESFSFQQLPDQYITVQTPMV